MITVVERSRNAKLGPISASYASIRHTCPTSCPLLGHGCYAQKGLVSIHERRLSQSRKRIDLAQEEARLIRGLSGKRPFRLHVSGDVVNTRGARLISLAMRDHAAKQHQPVWGYTHRWKQIPKTAWNGVSVLASCHSPEEVHQAKARGYAPCVVLPEAHPTRRPYEWEGLKIIPCPAQAEPRTVHCGTCRICSHTAWAERGLVLGFQPD